MRRLIIVFCLLSALVVPLIFTWSPDQSNQRTPIPLEPLHASSGGLVEDTFTHWPMLLSNKEIAERVERAYREASGLQVHTRISQIPFSDGFSPEEVERLTRSVMIDSFMMKGAFLSIVRVENERLAQVLCLCAGTMKECADVDGILQFAECASPYPNGTDRPHHELNGGSLWNDYLFSWVGVPAENTLPPMLDRASWLRTSIENGIREPDEIDRHHDCYVIRSKIPAEGPTKLEHKFYIEKDTGFVRRCDTTYGGVKRERRYGHVVTELTEEKILEYWEATTKPPENKI